MAAGPNRSRSGGLLALSTGAPAGPLGRSDVSAQDQPGDRYEYLTGQVAGMDSTEKGRTGLASYHTQKGDHESVRSGVSCS